MGRGNYRYSEGRRGGGGGLKKADHNLDGFYVCVFIFRSTFAGVRSAPLWDNAKQDYIG